MSGAEPWALDLLRGARVGRLGTADRSGHPLVVPLCYAFDGRACYFAVDDKPKRTRALRRLRNIAENPSVSLLVDEYDEAWERLRWVIVEGRADIVADAAEVDRAARLLREKYPQYRAMNIGSEAGTILRIVPARVLAWRAA